MSQCCWATATAPSGRLGITVPESVPNSIAMGDLDGDGVLDLATANFSDKNASVLLGNGDGTFRTAVNYSAGITSFSVAIGDLNADGVLHRRPLRIYTAMMSPVLLGNGNGTFRPALYFVAGDIPLSVAIGDRSTGDGILDLVAVANGGSNNVSVAYLCSLTVKIRFCTPRISAEVNSAYFFPNSKLPLHGLGSKSTTIFVGKGYIRVSDTQSATNHNPAQSVSRIGWGFFFSKYPH